MSKIQLQEYTLKAVKAYYNGTTRELPLFTSKGTQSYKDGVWGYYRSFRFGTVLGFFDGTTVRFTIKRGSKKVAELCIKGDKFTFYKLGKTNIFRRGGTACHYFLNAVESLSTAKDNSYDLETEVLCYLSFFCTHLLPVWDQPKEGIHKYGGALGSTYGQPAWKKLLFPLLNYEVISGSTRPSYKLLRGEKSLKNATKKLFGVAGSTYTKHLVSLLSNNDTTQIDIISMLIKAGASKEHSLLVASENRSVKTETISALINAISVEKTVKWLSKHVNNTYLEDIVSMMGLFPALELDKEIKGLDHLHAVLCYMHNNVEQGDADLWVHPEFYTYEGQQVEGYTIRFPEKISDLKYWGTHLGICIGSYGGSVHTGQSIAFALYKEDKPCVCVEILGVTHKLHQVYGKHNSAQPKELHDALSRLLLSTPKKVLVDNGRTLNMVYKNLNVQSLYKDALYHVAQEAEAAAPRGAAAWRNHNIVGGVPF